jgi:Ca2+-binding RTX toxin-like protein
MATTVTYNTVLVGGESNGDFQTNTFELLNQLAPDALGLSGGGFVSAYNSESLSNGFITLNFYSPAQKVIGTHRFAFDSDSDAVGQPKLTELANGNVLVVWDDDNSGDSGDQAAGMRAAIFQPNGVPVALDIDLVPIGEATGFTQVDVAATEGDGFVVAYAFGGDIFYRTYTDTGVQVGSHVIVNTITSGVQADPQVTVLQDGAFVVTWTDTNPTDQLIKARIFEANGTPRTGEFNASPGTGDNTQSSIAALKNGGFAVVYTDTGWSEPTGITLSIVSAAGAVGSPILVNSTSPTNEDSDADVTVLDNGFIAVTWSHAYSADDRDVFCRVFDQAGVEVIPQFDIVSTGYDQVSSAVSAMLGGMFITSWQDEAPDDEGGSIRSQVTEITRDVVGDATSDTFVGDALRDHIDGGDGNNTLSGAGGDDTLIGGAEFDSLIGGLGDDLIEGGLSTDTISGGDGDDEIYGNTKADPSGSTFGDLINAGAGDDKVRCSGGEDTVDAGIGADKLGGGAGHDQMFASDGQDKVKGQSGNDTLEGGYDSDTLNGGVGDDVLWAYKAEAIDLSGAGDYLNGANGADSLHGSGGADALVGLAGKDFLEGRSGADTLSGGNDKDILIGGAGADTLTGGSDKDVFRFEAITDSMTGAEDRITDLGNQDSIDLSAIDAKTGNPNDQAFTLVDAFTGQKGQLVVDYHSAGDYAGDTTIQGDVDGDGVADFTIVASGDRHNFSHFVL